MSEPEDDLIRRQLESLSHDQLVARLLSLAQRDDALRLALVAETEAAAGELDLRALRKDLTAQLRVTDRTYDRRYARRYAGEVEEALDVLAALLDAGHADAVVDLAEHCMKRLDTALRHLDDSGGYVGVAVDRLMELHHAACAGAAPDPAELARRLADWALASDSDLGVVSRCAHSLRGRARRRRSRRVSWPGRARVAQAACGASVPGAVSRGLGQASLRGGPPA